MRRSSTATLSHTPPDPLVSRCYRRLFASISPELHVQSSCNFLLTSPMAVARFFSGGVAIRRVLPALWMTSCLHTMAMNGDAKKAHTQNDSAGVVYRF